MAQRCRRYSCRLISRGRGHPGDDWVTTPVSLIVTQSSEDCNEVQHGDGSVSLKEIGTIWGSQLRCATPSLYSLRECFLPTLRRNFLSQQLGYRSQPVAHVSRHPSCRRTIPTDQQPHPRLHMSLLS